MKFDGSGTKGCFSLQEKRKHGCVRRAVVTYRMTNVDAARRRTERQFSRCCLQSVRGKAREVFLVCVRVAFSVKHGKENPGRRKWDAKEDAEGDFGIVKDASRA